MEEEYFMKRIIALMLMTLVVGVIFGAGIIGTIQNYFGVFLNYFLSIALILFAVIAIYFLFRR